MKKFLALYIGTATAMDKAQWKQMDEKKRQALEKSGMDAWMAWGQTHASAILDNGAPLGKTKCASADGIVDVINTVTGYTIVQAESHQAAAEMFKNHPHFSVFPGDSVEIMECLALPGL